MEYISSDTNVWIDFYLIQEINLPFLLPYNYIMWEEAVEDELIKPSNLKDLLLQHGLLKTEIMDDELLLISQYANKYKRLSTYDRVALAISKNRKIKLLTGDKALRNAAKEEKVDFIGTLGILDELLNSTKISSETYIRCMEKFLNNNNSIIRLPSNEIIDRINKAKR